MKLLFIWAACLLLIAACVQRHEIRRATLPSKVTIHPARGTIPEWTSEKEACTPSAEPLSGAARTLYFGDRGEIKIVPATEQDGPHVVISGNPSLPP